jgi:hypothetical protein
MKTMAKLTFSPVHSCITSSIFSYIIAVAVAGRSTVRVITASIPPPMVSTNVAISRALIARTWSSIVTSWFASNRESSVTRGFGVGRTVIAVVINAEEGEVTLSGFWDDRTLREAKTARSVSTTSSANLASVVAEYAEAPSSA